MIEKAVGIFIPPACREEVLGDLRERNDGSLFFFFDALRTVPFVIASRIQRTTDSVVLLMEAFCCYISFLTASWILDRTLVSSREGMLRLAIPCAIALAMLVLADAYANPKKKSVLRPILAVALAFAAVGIALTMFPLLPGKLVAVGSGMSMLFLLVLRMLFPPLADRPQQVQGPAFWQKQEIVAAGVLKATAAIAGILLVVSWLPAHSRGAALASVIIGGAIYWITRII